MTKIYGLIDPRNSQLRYIGKTRVPMAERLRQHTGTRKALHSSHWVHGLKLAGYTPEVVVLEDGLSETEWPDAEQFWIAYFKALGCSLTNHTEGGHHIVKAKGVKVIPATAKEIKVYQTNHLFLAKLKLTAMEYRILHYLQGIADYDNIAQTSQVFLAQQLETTEATISVSLKRLDELGVVHKIPYHGRTAFQISQKVSTRGKVK